MTTISASTAYALQALYGQNATQTANTKTGTAQTGTQSSTASTTTGTTTTSASLADILAAARNSASLPFATVGQNARSVLDAGVAAYGQTPTDQTSDDDWTSIFGGMDRRSLFAVSSNQGGQFSTLEQTAAKALMSQQVTDAGTVNSTDPVSTQLAGYAKRIDLLSNVSPEEKQTATWAYAYAAARTNANMIDFELAHAADRFVVVAAGQRVDGRHEQCPDPGGNQHRFRQRRQCRPDHIPVLGHQLCQPDRKRLCRQLQSRHVDQLVGLTRNSCHCAKRPGCAVPCAVLTSRQQTAVVVRVPPVSQTAIGRKRHDTQTSFG